MVKYKTREDFKGNCSMEFRLDSHDSGQGSMMGVANTDELPGSAKPENALTRGVLKPQEDKALWC
jgi:hypothetical protein